MAFVTLGALSSRLIQSKIPRQGFYSHIVESNVEGLLANILNILVSLQQYVSINMFPMLIELISYLIWSYRYNVLYVHVVSPSTLKSTCEAGYFPHGFSSP